MMSVIDGLKNNTCITFYAQQNLEQDVSVGCTTCGLELLLYPFKKQVLVLYLVNLVYLWTETFENLKNIALLQRLSKLTFV